jgi:hypothetical protein
MSLKALGVSLLALGVLTAVGAVALYDHVVQRPHIVSLDPPMIISVQERPYAELAGAVARISFFLFVGAMVALWLHILRSRRLYELVLAEGRLEDEEVEVVEDA